MCRIHKSFSFSERGSLTELNGTITNVQLLMTLEKFNFFRNFKKLLMGATTKKWKILADRKKNHWSLRIRQF